MKLLLKKELFLAASPLTYIFLVASFMTMLPGYPILVGAFFICFGIFHSFQATRETNDTLYTVLLPVKKADIVGAKYAFTCLIQMIGFAVCSALTFVRMTRLCDSEPYVKNAMMNATPIYLAFVLLIFAAFNILFVGGFFKTGYKIGIPYLKFGIAVL
ncbi:MAG: ABC-2 transporter permease, partial [Clostridia bacterium]|nr:ABC-2 transporter permease [Clostridia bacterium]